jgi:hypothetical protein
LHAKTRCLKMSLVKRKPYEAEVTLLDREKREWRYPVDLQNMACSCRQWQITGLPCIHVLFFITSLHGPAAEIDQYVHECCRYPEDRVPPHTNSKLRQGAGRVSTRYHASCSFGPCLPAEVGSRAATCPAALAPTAQPGAAPGLPRVLRLQLPLPSPGQLWGRHVPCGSSSRCLARGSSGAATCALKAQRSACY